MDNIAPAGSINSSAADMARWVRFQLGDGAFETKRLLSPAILKEMHAAQTVIPVSDAEAKFNPDTHLSSYGLGWFLSDYRGKFVAEHGGNIDGMTALVALMPEQRLGLIVLTNSNGSQLPKALKFTIFDRYLKAPPRDWSADMRKRTALAEAIQKKKEKKDDERVKDTKPSLAVEKYAGEYTHEVYAPMRVTAADGKLSAAFNGVIFDLEHWHFDTFRATDRNKRLAKFNVTFALNGAGKVSEAKTRLVAEDLVFKRTPEPAMAEPKK
jgi:hypothetical protein